MKACGNIIIDSLYKTSESGFDNNDLITEQYLIDRIEYVKTLLPFGVIQTITPIPFIKDEFVPRQQVDNMTLVLTHNLNSILCANQIAFDTSITSIEMDCYSIFEIYRFENSSYTKLINGIDYHINRLTVNEIITFQITNLKSEIFNIIIYYI